ncbi:DUF397 domain-containing protein [Nocardia sp. CDC159]|uniref:DUF397 domain-containing protein n=1 Tax=Nocardia pulmonis TaxID=2951408 RepID=A0A9X2E604_9NOCA|nr:MULTISPECIES: DUF397 domain-containing protein [Nocardia]MCM6774454.1 DUF397 domain-containing protein [Nocardia pulmonis]MCM6787480.1 DUF397 domain-containing protein [Nocardia sp. CDC159]
MSVTSRPTRTGWFKSSFSNQGTSCVEVRFDGDVVLIRDSKYLRNAANDPRQQPIIAIPVARWAAFLDLATGEASLGSVELPTVDVRRDGSAQLTATDGTTLSFTPDEWCAFTAGIGIGEFAAA